MTRSILTADFANHATRLPAWSGLAQQVQGESAAEMVAQLDYTVTEIPLALADTGENITTHKAIMASSRSTPQARKCIAVTSADYHLLTPEDDGELCSRYMRRAPDAIGPMGNGIGLWMLFALGKLSIRGDESDLNLLYVSPKNGNGAVMLRLQPLRIVCSNAITMSSRTATETYRAVHDSHVRERTEQWFEHIVEQLPLRQRLLQDEFVALSDTRVPDDLARRILADVYADPPKPVNDAPEEIMRERFASWEQRRARIAERRSTALNLYQGQGTGLDSPACKGTAYGLLNAVTELEDWSRSHTAQTRAESCIFGARAGTKAKAFTILLDLARDL